MSGDMFKGISFDQILENSIQYSENLNIPKLYAGNCLDVLHGLDSCFVHMVLTDPPYFLDGLDDKWGKGIEGKRGTGTVGGLPAGMKFDPKQGVKLQAFLAPIAEQLFRVMVPGGFALMFSSPRLMHRMAIAVEDAGFEIRDQYIWHYTQRAQFKAFSMDHLINKREDFTTEEKKNLIKELKGWKTPQLRPQFESILCAQKPKEGTIVDNWKEYGTGLIDSSQTLQGTVPSTVMTVEKATKEKYNSHLTPKPLHICEHLIKLFTQKSQVVLDPFVGSGTTCISAFKSNRQSIGIDINSDYLAIAKQRIEEYTR